MTIRRSKHKLPIRYFRYRIRYSLLCFLQARWLNKLLAEWPPYRKLLMKSGRLKTDINGNLNWKKYYANHHHDIFLDRGVVLFTFFGFLPLILKLSRHISEGMGKPWQFIVLLLCSLTFIAILMILCYRLPDWQSHYERFEKEPETITRKWHLISFLTILVIIALYVTIWYRFI